MKTIGQKVLELVFRLAPADSQEAFLRPKLHGHYNLKYLNPSYSQEGEDMVLARYLEGQKNGFYVDVGAHHPFRFSNTYHFYLKGWHGVNIDPLLGMKDLFDEFRPRDTNLEVGVSCTPGELVYYAFDEPALNTFDEKRARKIHAETKYNLVSETAVKVERLDELLGAHLCDRQELVFLTVDVEGRDLDVLRSNDWERFRPRMVVAEGKDFFLESKIDEVGDFLRGQGYRLCAKTRGSWFFWDCRK